MEIVAIQGHRKEGSGKEGAKKIRYTGLVPAIMYKSGGGEATQFAVSSQDYRPLVYTPKFRLVEISLNGTTHKCILKDIQFHPVTDEVIHIDFLELVPGVKFIPKMRQVNILTTPEKIVDGVSADISEMELGSTIRVRDISAIEGVEITNNSAVPIASIEVPRALRGK